MMETIQYDTVIGKYMSYDEDCKFLTCMYLCAYNSTPSLNHVMCGSGDPLATHMKAILWPSTYCRLKWEALVMRAPWGE